MNSLTCNMQHATYINYAANNFKVHKCCTNIKNAKIIIQ